jgi:hypothetical protein
MHVHQPLGVGGTAQKFSGPSFSGQGFTVTKDMPFWSEVIDTSPNIAKS